MKVYFGADHAGFELKEKLLEYVTELGHHAIDLGAYEYDPEDDFPDFIVPVAHRVSQSFEPARGIVLGGSGQGEAIAANRFQRIRCVVFNGQYDPRDGRNLPDEIILSREHNDSNMLSLGARYLNEDEAKMAVRVWLATEFSNDERHVRRLQKITDIDVF